MAEPLFWNRTGRIACVRHAPLMTDERWARERWEQMTDDERDTLLPMFRLPLSCFDCDREQAKQAEALR